MAMYLYIVYHFEQSKKLYRALQNRSLSFKMTRQKFFIAMVAYAKI